MAINRLSRATALTLADSLPISSVTGGDDQKAALQEVLSLIQANLVLPGLIRQGATPTATGFNVAITAADTWLVITPLATYAAGTITLPSAKVQDDEIVVNTTQTVTALTVSGNGATVVGAPTTLAAGGFFRLRYDAVNSTWYRVG